MTTETKKENDENLVSIETADFQNKDTVMNSPRSIEACMRLGVAISELYFVDFETYKNQNPDMRNLPKDIQQKRFDGIEKLRNDTISEVKEMRQKIIDEEKEAKEQSKGEETGNRGNKAGKGKL